MTRLLGFSAALAVALLTAGCPGAKVVVKQVGALELQFDDSKDLKVGEELQLHLKYAGQPSNMMVGALIVNTKSTTAKWFSDPEDAVSFDAGVSKAKFLKDGPVKVWATYKSGDRTMKSNVVHLIVGSDGGVAAVSTGTPAGK